MSETKTPESTPSKNTVSRLLWLSLSIFTSAPIAILYGLGTRLVFGQVPGIDLPEEIMQPLSALSVAFMFLVPLAIGALTVAFAPAEWRSSLVYAIAMPLLNCMLWTMVVTLLLWEAAICIIMALPIVLPLAVVGGLIIHVIFRVSHSLRGQVSAVAVLVILPYLIAPVESRFPVQDSFPTVETSILIKSDPSAVWRNMVRVPAIQPGERDFRLYHLLSLPWPVAAMLDHDGLGGVRHASYENGLTFNEPITAWEPDRTFSFDINVIEPEQLPMPYNAIGSPVFTTLNGTFTIEPVDAETVKLTLVSEHRLTTRFNAYGGFWIKWMMSDLQNHILHIIKTRAEAGL